jgi:hypothetical protein
MIADAGTMRDCGRLKHHAIGRARLLELVQQARLADARLADYSDYLTMAVVRHFERAADLLDFVQAPDKLRKSAFNRNFKMALRWAGPPSLHKHSEERSTFDSQCSQRLQVEIAFDQHPGLIAHRNRAGGRDRLQPCSEVRSMTDRIVFGVPAGSDLTQHHLAGIHADAGCDW